MEVPQPYHHPNHQVRASSSEHGRSFRSDEIGNKNTVVGTHDAMLKRVELPTYDGSDTYGWFALAEKFFALEVTMVEGSWRLFMLLRWEMC